MEDVFVEKKGITGSTLKILACVAMLIDHMGAVLLESGLVSKYTLDHETFMREYGTLYSIDIAMRLIGRIAFPIFCFLLVEGFEHTGNVRKYARNLGFFALLSEIPFNLAFATALGGELHNGIFYPEYQSVYMTLFLGLLTLCGCQYMKKKQSYFVNRPLGRALAVVGGLLGSLFMACFAVEQWETENRDGLFWCMVALLAILICIGVQVYGKKNGREEALLLCCELTVAAVGIRLAELLKTDYAGMGILTIFLMYLFRANKEKAMTWGCAALTVFNPMEVTSFFAVPLVKKYNGQRGWKLKYFFYAFYPVHLLILYFIAKCFILR